MFRFLYVMMKVFKAAGYSTISSELLPKARHDDNIQLHPNLAASHTGEDPYCC